MIWYGYSFTEGFHILGLCALDLASNACQNETWEHGILPSALLSAERYSCLQSGDVHDSVFTLSQEAAVRTELALPSPPS